MASKQVDVFKSLEHMLRNAPKKVVERNTRPPDEGLPLAPVNPDLPAMPGKSPSPLDLLQEIADNTHALREKRNNQGHHRIMAYRVTSDAVTGIPGNPGRSSLSLNNQGPDTVYIVRSYMVDTSEGMPIPANDEREIKSTDDLYLLSAGTSSVRTLEELM